MKKLLLAALSLIVTASVLAGCAAASEAPKESAAVSEAPKESAAVSPSPDATEETAAAPYEFEFTDIDGNVHRMSDYKGKPVYLRIWGSWCSVCVKSLPELDELAAGAEDFYVLTVVPKVTGEKDAEAFAAWFKDQGYEHIVVMYDSKAQVISDFGVSAFPSQIMFDENGVPVYGTIGELGNEVITQTMAKIIQRSAG